MKKWVGILCLIGFMLLQGRALCAQSVRIESTLEEGNYVTVVKQEPIPFTVSVDPLALVQGSGANQLTLTVLLQNQLFDYASVQTDLPQESSWSFGTDWIEWTLPVREGQRTLQFETTLLDYSPEAEFSVEVQMGGQSLAFWEAAVEEAKLSTREKTIRILAYGENTGNRLAGVCYGVYDASRQPMLDLSSGSGEQITTVTDENGIAVLKESPSFIPEEGQQYYLRELPAQSGSGCYQSHEPNTDWIGFTLGGYDPDLGLYPSGYTIPVGHRAALTLSLPGITVTPRGHDLPPDGERLSIVLDAGGAAEGIKLSQDRIVLSGIARDEAYFIRDPFSGVRLTEEGQYTLQLCMESTDEECHADQTKYRLEIHARKESGSFKTTCLLFKENAPANAIVFEPEIWVSPSVCEYQFTGVDDGDRALALPDTVLALCPPSAQIGEGFAVQMPAHGTMPDPEKIGVWKFEGYTYFRPQERYGELLRVQGKWRYTEKQAWVETDQAGYIFRAETEGKERAWTREAWEQAKAECQSGRPLVMQVEEAGENGKTGSVWTLAGLEEAEIRDGKPLYTGKWTVQEDSRLADYVFESQDGPVPQTVLDLLPAQAVLSTKEPAVPVMPARTQVEDGTGIWTFAGYTPEQVYSGTERIRFTGWWHCEEKRTEIWYAFVSGTGEALPQAIEALVPEKQSVPSAELSGFEPKKPEKERLRTESGIWYFAGYDAGTDAEMVRTYTGKWTYLPDAERVYEVMLKGNGGTFEGKTELSVQTAAGQQLPLNRFIRDGYVFSGWAREADGPVGWDDGDAYDPYREEEWTERETAQTLFAVWSPVEKSTEPVTGRILFEPEKDWLEPGEKIGISIPAAFSLPEAALEAARADLNGTVRIELSGSAQVRFPESRTAYSLSGSAFQLEGKPEIGQSGGRQTVTLTLRCQDRTPEEVRTGAALHIDGIEAPGKAAVLAIASRIEGQAQIRSKEPLQPARAWEIGWSAPEWQRSVPVTQHTGMGCALALGESMDGARMGVEAGKPFPVTVSLHLGELRKALQVTDPDAALKGTLSVRLRFEEDQVELAPEALRVNEQKGFACQIMPQAGGIDLLLSAEPGTTGLPETLYLGLSGLTATGVERDGTLGADVTCTAELEMVQAERILRRAEGTGRGQGQAEMMTQFPMKILWKDAENAAGMRPSEVEVGVYAGGERAGSAVLKQSENWETTLHGLPVVTAGIRNTYSCRAENLPACYQESVEGGVISLEYFDPSKELFLEGKVSLEGRACADGQFAVEAECGQSGEKCSAVCRSDGSFRIGPFTVTGSLLEGKKERTLSYTLRQTGPDAEGYILDRKPKTVSVLLKRLPDGSIAWETKGAQPEFKNRYEAKGQETVPVQVLVEGELLGKNGLVPATDLQFPVELVRLEGGREKVLETAESGRDGMVRFKPLSFTQADMGMQEFLVRQKPGKYPGIELDDTVHFLHLNVADNGNGTLTVTEQNREGSRWQWIRPAYALERTLIFRNSVREEQLRVYMDMSRASGADYELLANGRAIAPETEKSLLSRSVIQEDGILFQNLPGADENGRPVTWSLRLSGLRDMTIRYENPGGINAGAAVNGGTISLSPVVHTGNRILVTLVWRGDEGRHPLDRVKLTLLRDGKPDSHGLRATKKDDNTWEYMADDLRGGVYTLQAEPIPGYLLSYENTGRYLEDRTACYTGGKIVFTKITPTGDRQYIEVYIALAAAALLGLLAVNRKQSQE